MNYIEIDRSRGSYWWDRFSTEGVAGLKNNSKSGRHPDIPKEIVHEIKN